MVFVRDADTRGALRAGPAYLRLLSSFDPLARSLFDRSPAQTGLRRGLINRALKKKRAVGILSRADCLWYVAAADSTISRQNWLSASYTLAAVNGPTFTADRGYTGDGASAYLTTGFVPSTAGGKFSLNDACMALWFRATITGTVRIPMGATDFSTTAYSTIEFTAGNDMLAKMNSASSSNAVVNGAAGPSNNLFVSERTGSAATRVMKNGVSQATTTFASTALPPIGINLLTRNSGGSPANYSADQISMAYIGGSMTDEQHTALYDIAREYLTAVGAI